MSLILLRRRLLRLRRRGAGVAVVLALAAAVFAHHAPLMAEGHMHHDGAATMELCLGILVVAGLTLVGAAVAVAAVRALSAAVLTLGHAGVALPCRLDGPRARAGPPAPLAPLLCVWRR